MTTKQIDLEYYRQGFTHAPQPEQFCEQWGCSAVIPLVDEIERLQHERDTAWLAGWNAAAHAGHAVRNEWLKECPLCEPAR